MNDQTIDHEEAKKAETVSRPPLVIQDSSAFQNLMDTSRFEQIQRVAHAYSCSGMVPENYQGNVAACVIAIQMAMRLDIDPMMFMQNTFILHGKPGMFSTLVIALVNKNGPFTGPIQFELSGEGDNRQCRAFTTHAKTREACEMVVSIAMAKAEGWIDKKGSKWKSIPDLMLRYRSAAWLARVYAPECIMGMQTIDEIEDVEGTAFRGPEKAKVINPEPAAPPPTAAAKPPAEEAPETEALANELAEQGHPEEAEQVLTDEPEAKSALNGTTTWQEMFTEMSEKIIAFNDVDELNKWLEIVSAKFDWVSDQDRKSGEELDGMVIDKMNLLKDDA